MNSLISTDRHYIGQYLCIKDDDFSARMFTKFYNLSVQNDNFLVTTQEIKNLIRSNKYDLSNHIYVNDPNSDDNVLKPVKPGIYMVYINDSKKLYLFTKSEFEHFIYHNELIKIKSSNFVLGIDDGLYFKNVKIITAGSLDIAKMIYKDRYETDEIPTCIGIEEGGHLNIFTDSYLISTAFDDHEPLLTDV